MPSKKTKTPIEEGKYYHIYNRGNNFEKVFLDVEDYKLFLEKFKQYLDPYVKTFAYCLNPNHYHLLIQVKNSDGSKSSASNEFRKLFLSYTNRINYKYGRSGNLFLRYFKRVEIKEMEYLKMLVFYIHNNPEKHGYCANFKDYPFSSFKSLLSNSMTSLCRDEVMHWFGSIEEFNEYHRFLHDDKKNIDILFEE